MVVSRRGLVVGALVGLLVAAGLPVAAHAEAQDITSVTMVSETGDWIGRGDTRLWRPGAGTVNVSSSDDGLVTVRVSGGASGDSFSMSFAAPSGESLVAGDYEDAERIDFRRAGHPGIDISGDGRGCTKIEGRFTVLDIAPDLTRLWLVYEQHCAGSEPALFGEVRYNVPGGDSDLMVAPGHVAWPDEYPGVPGRDVPVTLVNTGSSPVVVSDATISAGAEDFVVNSSSCATLEVASSCTVQVAFEPSTTGTRTGTLTIEDSTPAGSHTVDLSGHGTPGHTSFAMRSERGDYIGGGSDWFYTPENSTIAATGHSEYVSVGAGDWGAQLAPSDGDTLQAGRTYPGAVRYPLGGPDEPSMAIAGNGRACNTVTGSFAIHEIAFDADGELTKLSATFEQHCEGGNPALFGTVAWQADAPAEPLPPRLTMATDRMRYGFGRSATVTATLSPDSPTRSVAIYARPYGRPKRLVTVGEVDADGKFSVPVRVVRRTKFLASAVVDGAPVRSVVNRRTVEVRAKVTPTMLWYRAKRGRYHIYDVSKRAVLKGRVAPNHEGDCLYFRVQFYIDGRWRYPTTTCVQMNPRSIARTYLAGHPDYLGVPIRMRAEWRGDRENLRKRSAWRYVRFRR